MTKRRVLLFCECTNCTHRWSEYDDERVGTIRCPVEDCGSKNVEIETEGDERLGLVPDLPLFEDD